jgi:hypothetical protein
MKSKQIIKEDLLTGEISLQTAISDVEKFIKEFKVENKSKWKSFKNVMNLTISESRKY